MNQFKLYKILTSCETVVRAESEENAIQEAKRVVKQEDDAIAIDSISEIKKIEDIPSGWDKWCLPWGGGRHPMDWTIIQQLEGGQP